MVTPYAWGISNSDPATANQPDIGQPNLDAHHSEVGLVPRSLPTLPDQP